MTRFLAERLVAISTSLPLHPNAHPSTTWQQLTLPSEHGTSRPPVKLERGPEKLCGDHRTSVARVAPGIDQVTLVSCSGKGSLSPLPPPQLLSCNVCLDLICFHLIWSFSISWLQLFYYSFVFISNKEMWLVQSSFSLSLGSLSVGPRKGLCHTRHGQG